MAVTMYADIMWAHSLSSPSDRLLMEVLQGRVRLTVGESAASWLTVGLPAQNLFHRFSRPTVKQLHATSCMQRVR